ncbi:response regulator [Hymenobacter puniceus]|uniref:response regulator n=1 Tax=Hymenobacter sp. BT190 TaxID=2763505 RepID=UPI001650F486|nr:response regulator [Hymenobacter sp. BT190]MBC6700102.1 response regulator [Hymenobacter sp. BT190]
MKILIVEDDELKREQIALFLNNSISNPIVDFAKSMNSGIRAIMDKKFDLVILDMSMPTFDVDIDENGGNPQYYGGSEILYEMERISIDTPVIIVTQFDKFGEKNNELTLSELDHQLKEDGLSNYKGAVYYNNALDDWKDNLTKMLNEISNA